MVFGERTNDRREHINAAGLFCLHSIPGAPSSPQSCLCFIKPSVAIVVHVHCTQDENLWFISRSSCFVPKYLQDPAVVVVQYSLGVTFPLLQNYSPRRIIAIIILNSFAHTCLSAIQVCVCVCTLWEHVLCLCMFGGVGLGEATREEIFFSNADHALSLTSSFKSSFWMFKDKTTTTTRSSVKDLLL